MDADFWLSLLTAVALQLLGVLGIFFILGTLIAFVQWLTQRNYYRSFGWKGILWTAWIGTPVHEIGHALFALLFRQKIWKISLFKPNQETGELGGVEYSYNRFNPLHGIGNFFIGIAPLLFGSAALVGLLFGFNPNAGEIIKSLSDLPLHSFSGMLSSLTEAGRLLFSTEFMSTWQFWVFLYLSFAVASHLAPSGLDRANMRRGLVWIIAILFIVNGLTLYQGVDITEAVISTRMYLGIFLGAFVYAGFLSLIHWLFSFVIRLIASPFRRKREAF